MTIRKTFAALGAIAALAFGTSQAFAQTEFDFSPEQANRPRTQPNPEAIKAIPVGFKFVREGYLTVAISPFAPPIGTYATDARTIVGADPDIAQLVADSLGLQLDLQAVAWPDWPLGLTSGRFDAVISNVGVTEERKEKFDFSTYRLGLHGFYVKADGPIRKIAEPKDIAGLRIVTGSGTNQERILLEWDRRNREAGLKPIEIQYYDDQAAIWLAIASDRVDANFNPNGPQAYEAAKTGAIRLVGTVNAGWPLKSDVAITTRKGSGFAEALTVALNGLIAGGQYQAALERWGLAEERLERSETNPPGLPKAF
jgi:polar amino acid transport system substrate-binding protein